MTASLSKDHRLALFKHRPLFGHVARSDMAVGDLLPVGYLSFSAQVL